MSRDLIDPAKGPDEMADVTCYIEDGAEWSALTVQIQGGQYVALAPPDSEHVLAFTSLDARCLATAILLECEAVDGVQGDELDIDRVVREALEQPSADLNADQTRAGLLAMEVVRLRAQLALAAAKRDSAAKIHVVFDGPPSAQGGRFIEVEDSGGRSVSVGRWIERQDGTWALELPDPRVR